MKTNPFFIAVSLLIAFASSMTTHAETLSVKTDESMTYSQMMKLMSSGDNEKITQGLQGKSVKIMLLASDTKNLVARAGDGVFFTCDNRGPGFTKGFVKTTITKVQTNQEGVVSLALAHCGA